MRNRYSLIAGIFIALIFISYRAASIKFDRERPLELTTWDALGYYMYLPGIFIYHDVKKLDWLPVIDAKYSVSGGTIYQAAKQKSGDYVFKYLGGVAILEAPFFFAAHRMAPALGYEADGFSQPYQYAVAIGALVYFILGLFILRKVLLKYFDDLTTTVTLVLMMLASNLVQYVSFDSAMSHAYIFPLYSLLLYFTIRWHEKPSILWASLIGFIVGLACISRPTEAVMIFIPILWNMHSKEASKEKWALVKQNLPQLAYLAFFGILGILPQLIYWKAATGSFVYDVGSKWDFLMPHIRVLFGFENGWFIYTPVTLFFIAGLFFIRRFPFRKAVITFCLLNIYIIIAWHDWRYGATYSCRALTQSYPVFALPLAAFINRFIATKWKYLVYIAGAYFIFVNLFQISQYNKTILHFRDMNRKYYCSIYLDPSPTPLDFSLLDTKELLKNDDNFNRESLFTAKLDLIISTPEYSEQNLVETDLAENTTQTKGLETWIKVEADLEITGSVWWGCYLNAEIRSGDSIKQNRIRIDRYLSGPGKRSEYAFFTRVPEDYKNGNLRVFISSSPKFEGVLREMKITRYLQK